MVNISKLKLTGLQQEILNLLCIKAGTSLNQNLISKILKVSQPAVAKALPTLEKVNYINIKKDKVSGRWDITLNRDNKKTLNLKRILNIQFIYASGLIDFLEEKFPGATIILFGSYSKGEDTTNSDIDFAVIGSEKKDINLKKFELIFERKIFIHFFPAFLKIPKELKENLCNGIVFSGGIEL